MRTLRRQAVVRQQVVAPLRTADATRDGGDDMRTQFVDEEFQFGLEIALGAAYRQASDVGESLATADRIADGDADSWVNEWMATAERTEAAGAAADSAGHRESALAYYRRGATYYATALYRFSGATD